MAAATKTPIQLKSIADEVVDILQGAIISGEYPPGQRLVERELTARFGVSSIPIREALHELESRGLVAMRHNHGCSVISLSAEELREIAKLRRVLEPKVIQWAAAKMTPEAAENIKRQLDRLIAAARAKDVSDYFYHDLIFHRLIWEASGNRYAAKALDSAVGSLFVSGLRRVKESGRLNLAAEANKHTLMFEALRDRKGALAARILLSIADSFEARLDPKSGGGENQNDD